MSLNFAKGFSSLSYQMVSCLVAQKKSFRTPASIVTDAGSELQPEAVSLGVN